LFLAFFRYDRTILTFALWRSLLCSYVLLVYPIPDLVFIRQDPFSYVGPNIFLKIFLSKTISLLVIVSFNIHVSHAYVTTGLITEKYNFSFVFLDMSLL